MKNTRYRSPRRGLRARARRRRDRRRRRGARPRRGRARTRARAVRRASVFRLRHAHERRARLRERASIAREHSQEERGARVEHETLLRVHRQRFGARDTREFHVRRVDVGEESAEVRGRVARDGEPRDVPTRRGRRADGVRGEDGIGGEDRIVARGVVTGGVVTGGVVTGDRARDALDGREVPRANGTGRGVRRRWRARVRARLPATLSAFGPNPTPSSTRNARSAATVGRSNASVAGSDRRSRRPNEWTNVSCNPTARAVVRPTDARGASSSGNAADASRPSASRTAESRASSIVRVAVCASSSFETHRTAE